LAIESAGLFASRLEREVGADRRAQLRRGWLLALGRQASENELDAAEAFLDRQMAALKTRQPEGDDAARSHRVLATLCQALLSANGFLYVD
ncbi:MAG TPA: hypothetical protein VGX76_10415, partial [Pirellulales bacterium]|nr:hypothetical protein [Pirellulales bacterium]